MSKPSQPAITIDLDETKAGAAATAPAAVVVDDDPGLVVDEEQDLVGGLPARAVRNGDGTVTLPLRFPVALTVRSSTGATRTESYAELTFHRLTGADIRALQSASKESQPALLLARSSRTREAVMNAVFDRMDAADIADASKVVESFFGAGRTNQG
ncbi:phage tail assembly protein [Xanthobacter sp. KR7-225]|uniref:phage tail assembly protein n=1 Tax=Xanthobacter sp. KR7-225 TaxID=3156613 RepID=UPI0032B3665A